MKTYTVRSLDDLAAYFDKLADDEGQVASRQSTKRDQRIGHARAGTWRSAAAMLRDTKIDPNLPDVKLLTEVNPR